MTDARQTLLDAIRRGLARAWPATKPAAARAAALSDPAPRPGWPQDRPARFLAQLERSAGTYSRINDLRALPEAAAHFLEAIGRPRRLVLGDDPRLAQLAWEGFELLKPSPRSADGAAAVVTAPCGVAETGSVVMTSGPARPMALNLLPDHLLVVLAAEDLVDYLEDVWGRLAAAGPLPRAVSFITGPSRTADVEQTIQIGAHGPRRLHVVLVD